jgi:arylsulfatase A-like enzyme
MNLRFLPFYLLAPLLWADSPVKPNCLLILADDLGFSDLGCYGSEIKTPNLDQLATDGLRISNFYNSARCSPTRASILTGLHPHQANFPNLSGRLPKESITLAEILKSAGYRTSMVGKWHLNPNNPPTERGFDEFYGMLGGYNSCWEEDPYYTRWPKDRTKRHYPAGKFYSTDAFADYAIDFIGQADSPQPWFQYLAFNAPHFPLHAPEADIAKYESYYNSKGWDRIREDRLAMQKKLGIVPANLALPDRSVIPANRFNQKTGWADKQNPAWDSLPEDRRHDLARRMAVFAAMIDHMDQAIGRVVSHLKATHQFENTVIIFLSDNGACAEWDPYGFDTTSSANNLLHTGAELKEVGGPASYISYGSAWANASNTPWQLYKHYTHEGGIRTPFIMHWPTGLKQHGMIQAAAHITDFMPTLCELAGASYPKQRDGTPLIPTEGLSLVPLMTGHSLPPRNIFTEHEGNRSVYDGEWKLVSLHQKPWELYHLSQDPTELTNLAAVDPARVLTLAATYDAWAARCKVRQNR